MAVLRAEELGVVVRPPALDVGAFGAGPLVAEVLAVDALVVAFFAAGFFAGGVALAAFVGGSPAADSALADGVGLALVGGLRGAEPPASERAALDGEVRPAPGLAERAPMFLRGSSELMATPPGREQGQVFP